jgi:hypothetical protein
MAPAGGEVELSRKRHATSALAGAVIANARRPERFDPRVGEQGRLSARFGKTVGGVVTGDCRCAIRFDRAVRVGGSRRSTLIGGLGGATKCATQQSGHRARVESARTVACAADIAYRQSRPMRHAIDSAPHASGSRLLAYRAYVGQRLNSPHGIMGRTSEPQCCIEKQVNFESFIRPDSIFRGFLIDDAAVREDNCAPSATHFERFLADPKSTRRRPGTGSRNADADIGANGLWTIKESEHGA